MKRAAAIILAFVGLPLMAVGIAVALIGNWLAGDYLDGSGEGHG